jgi:RNA polymerase sigma-70 factor (ECF subfamily)
MRADAARAGSRSEGAGSLRAFETEADFVYRALRRQGVAETDVEDLAQDVFVVLCRRWHELDHGRPLRPWLSGVIVKLAQQHRRRMGRFVPAGVVDREDSDRSADDQLGGARARALITRALSQLPDKHRVVLVMHDLEGVPMREIATSLAVPLFTAYTRLRAGRRKLSKAIAGLHAPQRQGIALAGRPWIAAAALVTLGLGVTLWSGRASRPGERAGAGVTGETPRSLARGLVGYWRFDEPEGAGRVFADGAGDTPCLLQSTDGAPHARRVQGVQGGALALDGKAWLECPRPGRLARLDTDLTIALWIRTSDTASRQALVTRQLGESGDRLFSVRLQRERVEFLSHVWKTQLARPYAGGGWTHLAAVRDATGTQLYLDGVQVGRNGRTVPGAIGGGSGALVIGGQENGPEPGQAQDRFRGALDELLVYDRALSGAEIGALAARVQPVPAPRE